MILKLSEKNNSDDLKNYCNNKSIGEKGWIKHLGFSKNIMGGMTAMKKAKKKKK